MHLLPFLTAVCALKHVFANADGTLQQRCRHGSCAHGSSDTPELEVSHDGSCGGDTGYTCEGNPFGTCCSRWGWCGQSIGYCGKGCQPDFGNCDDDDEDPQSNPGPVKKPSVDGRCGPHVGLTCDGYPYGKCCSQYGWCGNGREWCGDGCDPRYGVCRGNKASAKLNPKSAITSAQKSSGATAKSSAQLLASSSKNTSVRTSAISSSRPNGHAKESSSQVIPPFSLSSASALGAEASVSQNTQLSNSPAVKAVASLSSRVRQPSSNISTTISISSSAKALGESNPISVAASASASAKSASPESAALSNSGTATSAKSSSFLGQSKSSLLSRSPSISVKASAKSLVQRSPTLTAPSTESSGAVSSIAKTSSAPLSSGSTSSSAKFIIAASSAARSAAMPSLSSSAISSSAQAIGPSPSSIRFSILASSGSASSAHPSASSSLNKPCGGNNNGAVCGDDAPCCSSAGYCGSSRDYCSANARCQPAFSAPGACTAAETVRGCGKNSGGATCNGFLGGGCCSGAGYCGKGLDYCSTQTGCQPAFSEQGACDSSSSETVRACGKNSGNAKCDGFPGGTCCSGAGYCGKGTDYCSAQTGCQPAFSGPDVCEVPPETVRGCGKYYNGATCNGFPGGGCCSGASYCGMGNDYCSAQTGCQPAFSSPGACQAVETVRGCGAASGGATCNGFSGGGCCSGAGFCGKGTDYCSVQTGCQSTYSAPGSCEVPAETTRSCGGLWNGETCNGFPGGGCCSGAGYCGAGTDYCSVQTGCQSAFSAPGACSSR